MILWVHSINQCFLISGLHFCVEDSVGNVLMLLLCNFVDTNSSFEKLQTMFPVNTRFGIKQPYLKVSNAGGICLRVDNPCNVVVQAHSTSKSTGASTLQPDNKMTSKRFKDSGNVAFAKKNYVDAAEEYSRGLNVANALHIDLLSNRAATYLQLHKFQSALEDCDAVFSIDPLHSKAQNRRKTATDSLNKLSAEELGHVSSAPDAVLLVAEAESREDPSEWKIDGNSAFMKKDFLLACQCYSHGINALKALKIILHSNRAAAHMQKNDFVPALDDCDVVLSLDPTHTKALHRKEIAAEGIREANNQKLGIYNFRTLPYDPQMQNCLENFYGPLEIKWLGSKGRGIVLTRDVAAGELLLVEKAFVYRLDQGVDKSIHFSPSVNFETNRYDKPSAHLMKTDLVALASKDPKANSLLALLAHDIKVPNVIVPHMDWFRSNVFPEFPQISAEQIGNAVSCNSFSFSLPEEPSRTVREDMTRTIGIGVDPHDFIKGYIKRGQSRLTSPDDGGSALWLVTSFINHSDKPNTLNEHFGQLKFVFANDFLKSGEELTISYGAFDESELKQYWGIPSKSCK
jgi:tetratricopeptide (TPR) repeat protein